MKSDKVKLNTRTTCQLLCRCLRGALGGRTATADLPANPTEWEKVLRLSGDQLVTTKLRWALQEKGLFSELPTDVAEYLEAIYTLNLARNHQSEDQLAELIPALNSVGVQPVLLKGAAAIVGGLYPTSGERMIYDLDILISPAKLPEIVDKLTGLGYQPRVSVGMKVPDPVGFKTDHHYPPLVNPKWPTRVELHIEPLWLSMVNFMSCDEVFQDATPLSWRGGECLLPSPTLFIVHNVVHGFVMNVKAGLEKVSLRKLFEFVLASQIYGERIDWNAIKSRFDDLGRIASLQEYLALANICFGMPPTVSIDNRDIRRARRHLTRLDSYNPGVEFFIRVLFQIRRVGHLRQDPMKLRMLLTADFYSRLFRSLKG